MRLLNSVYVDLKKSIFSPYFVVCIAVTTILMLSSLCYVDESERYYSIYDLMLYYPRDELSLNISFSSYMVFSNGLGSWLSMFVPIVAAFPLVPVFCTERSNNSLGFPLIRVGRKNFLISKCIASVLSGGIAVTIGYAIFGIIVFSYFPAVESFPETVTDIFTQMLFPYGVFVAYMKKFMCVFCYGAFYSLPALAMSVFTSNKYIVLCVPFLVKYLYDTVIQKITVDAMDNGNADVLNISGSLSSNSIITGGLTAESITFYVLAAIALMLLFVLLMNKKLKHGE